MQLVILAAGFGTRFGGLKQLAAVGPNDEAIMDYTARAAARLDFSSVVVVVRPEIESEMRAHIEGSWPKGFAVDFVHQPAQQGTAPAVLAAGAHIKGPFAVANADDLYGDEAIAMIRNHFEPTTGAPDDRHLLVAYRLSRTVLGASSIKRGLCEVDEHGDLAHIAEQVIDVRGTSEFIATPIGRSSSSHAASTARKLSGDEWVSMNLWGFHARVFDDLERAVAMSDGSSEEVLLPDVVEQVVSEKDERVHVIVTEARCIGLTNRDDLPMVRAQILSSV